MKETALVSAGAISLSRSRLADYVELTKPRIAVMVLCTVAAGFCLARPDTPALLVMVHALIGTGLVAAGASALNQLLERHSDALMRRTENRPLPSGRLQPYSALVFGLVLGVTGLIYLAVFTQQWLCVALAALTFVLYVWVYTPLKKQTSLNTLVGVRFRELYHR